MIDSFGRPISYLRVSVTDRCDLRCTYCMPNGADFIKKSQVLSLEELYEICQTFIDLGVKKIRLTGGEPLVRRNIEWLIKQLGTHLNGGGLDELTLTTNATQLTKYVDILAENGVKRINISLDTLSPDRFLKLTQGGQLDQVLMGIQAAKSAGLAIKINTVVLKGINDQDLHTLVQWCGENGFDQTFIEVMPMGAIGESRLDYYVPLTDVRDTLSQNWTLIDTTHQTGGPARYVQVQETGTHIGFISPLSNCFCESCNRVRLSAKGQLFMCLGQEASVDLKNLLHKDEPIKEAVQKAIALKPKGHNFNYNLSTEKETGTVSRHMSATGG